MIKQKQYLIIGAGLAGLAAALKIEKQGGTAILIEEDPVIGGKLKTELFEETYLLDHGFQVLLPGYSQLQNSVDLAALDLRYFKSGALVFDGNKKIRISDPFKDPHLLFETLLSEIGSFKDKCLVLKLKLSVLSTSDHKLLGQRLGSSIDFLRNYGFSEKMIENFWRPFFSGIFLEDQLLTEGSYLKFLFKMFSKAPVAVPAKGIAELPRWMSQQLKKSEILLGSRAQHVSANQVILQSGKTFNGIVIDTRPAENKKWGAVTTLYFSAAVSPIAGPWLFLNRKTSTSLINHVAVMTEVCPSYSRAGDVLISVNALRPALGNHELLQIREELQIFFGPDVKKWRFLESS